MQVSRRLLGARRPAQLDAHLGQLLSFFSRPSASTQCSSALHACAQPHAMTCCPSTSPPASLHASPSLPSPSLPSPALLQGHPDGDYLIRLRSETADPATREFVLSVVYHNKPTQHLVSRSKLSGFFEVNGKKLVNAKTLEEVGWARAWMATNIDPLRIPARPNGECVRITITLSASLLHWRVHACTACGCAGGRQPAAWMANQAEPVRFAV